MRTLIIVTLLSIASLVGCGYKGPLYMPEAKADGKKSGTPAIPEPAPDRPTPAQAAPPPK